MIISISGSPGSGKSTVAKILAEKLGYERYYMGALHREMAKERGMTLDELNRLEEKDAFADNEVDEYQRRLGREKDNFVIEGRTSFHFIPHSFKVFIAVDPVEGARRIFSQQQAEGNEGRNERMGASIDETRRFLAERCASDTKRYMQYYGFDCFDTSLYDLVVDSTNITPEEVAEKIITESKKR